MTARAPQSARGVRPEYDFKSNGPLTDRSAVPRRGPSVRPVTAAQNHRVREREPEPVEREALKAKEEKVGGDSAGPQTSLVSGAAVSHYALGKTIGEGTFGKVKKGIHKLTGITVAVKILEKDRIVEPADVERVRREIHILTRVRHPNVIRLYEVIDSPKHIFLIMEFAPGGELFDYIVKKGRVKEREAARFFHMIVNGIDYCHQKNIIHRDLKPENLLLDKDGSIKIVDFGLGNIAKDGKLLKTACGSPCYAAPEMIAGKRYVGAGADMWSLGVILFALVCGYLPFEDPNTAKLYEKIMGGIYEIPPFISAGCRDLIQRLLNTDPRTRFTADQVRQHPWYSRVTAPSDPELRNSMDTSQDSKDGAVAAASVYEDDPLDQEVIRHMMMIGYNPSQVLESVSSNKHDHYAATYHLLAAKRRMTKAKAAASVPAKTVDGATAAAGSAAAGSAAAAPSASSAAAAVAPLVPRLNLGALAGLAAAGEAMPATPRGVASMPVSSARERPATGKQGSASTGTAPSGVPSAIGASALSLGGAAKGEWQPTSTTAATGSAAASSATSAASVQAVFVPSSRLGPIGARLAAVHQQQQQQQQSQLPSGVISDFAPPLKPQPPGSGAAGGPQPPMQRGKSAGVSRTRRTATRTHRPAPGAAEPREREPPATSPRPSAPHRQRDSHQHHPRNGDIQLDASFMTTSRPPSSHVPLRGESPALFAAGALTPDDLPLPSAAAGPVRHAAAAAAPPRTSHGSRRPHPPGSSSVAAAAPAPSHTSSHSPPLSPRGGAVAAAASAGIPGTPLPPAAGATARPDSPPQQQQSVYAAAAAAASSAAPASSATGAAASGSLPHKAAAPAASAGPIGHAVAFAAIAAQPPLSQPSSAQPPSSQRPTTARAAFWAPSSGPSVSSGQPQSARVPRPPTASAREAALAAAAAADFAAPPLSARTRISTKPPVPRFRKHRVRTASSRRPDGSAVGAGSAAAAEAAAGGGPSPRPKSRKSTKMRHRRADGDADTSAAALDREIGDLAPSAAAPASARGAASSSIGPIPPQAGAGASHDSRHTHASSARAGSSSAAAAAAAGDDDDLIVIED